MTIKWLVDTNILIDYMRGRADAVKFVEEVVAKSLCYLSSITVAELYAGVREGKERRLLEQFFAAFDIASVDGEIVRIGGLYRRDYGKSHGVGLADAIIAATAEFHRAKLATLNKKHFPMLAEVHVPY